MKKIWIVVIIVLMGFDSFSQITIKGSVKDEKGEILVGATIYLSEDNSVGTTSDYNGNYVLEIKHKYKGKIQASYVGYSTQYKDIDSTIWQNNKTKNNKAKNNIVEINFSLKQEAKYLDQVVVTGTRTPKLLSESPIQTRLITAEEIGKASANNISDVLQQELPGIEFSYAMNQQVNVNLNGFSGQGVLFLVDGERLSGETMDNVDFQRLDMNNVERIEIVKGAASALYGSSAAGGVINIITKENSTKPLTIGLSGRYGSHNEKKLGLNIGLNKGIFHNTFSLQHTGIDTYTVPYNENNDFNSVYGGKTWNFKDKIIINPLDNLKFTAHAGYFFRERLYNEDKPDRYRDFTGGIKGKWEINEKNDVELSYNFDQYDKSDYTKHTGKDIRDYSNVQNSVRALYNYSYFESNNGDNQSKRLIHKPLYTITVGADFMHDYLYSYQFTDGDKQQNTADIFAQYDWDINDYWEVVGALRYDYFSDGGKSHLTPKLSLRYHRDHWTIRAGYGGGFRSPTLKEKYMDFDMAGIFKIRGNKNLKSETSNNFNVSSEYVYDIFNFTASAYYNLVKNRIANSDVQNDNTDGDAVGTSSGNYIEYINVENMNVYGGELSLQARFPVGLNTKISYCYTKEEVKQKGTLTPYAPARPHTLVLRVDYDKQLTSYYGFNIALNARFLSNVESEKYDATTNTSTMKKYPSYMICKLSISQRLYKNCNLSFIIDNLLDYTPDIYYFNSPTTAGRTYLFDLSFHF